MENYKEKYKDALDRAREQYNKRTPLYDIESIFPELKETEGEKIRKAIHIYLDWLDGRKDYEPKGDYSIKDMITWLEKQDQLKEEDKKEDIVARYPCAGDPIPCGANCENNLSHEGVMDRFEILNTIKDQMMNGNGDIFTFTKWLQEFIDKEIGNTPLIMSY